MKFGWLPKNMLSVAINTTHPPRAPRRTSFEMKSVKTLTNASRCMNINYRFAPLMSGLVANQRLSEGFGWSIPMISSTICTRCTHTVIEPPYSVPTLVKSNPLILLCGPIEEVSDIDSASRGWFKSANATLILTTPSNNLLSRAQFTLSLPPIRQYLHSYPFHSDDAETAVLYCRALLLKEVIYHSPHHLVLTHPIRLLEMGLIYFPNSYLAASSWPYLSSFLPSPPNSAVLRASLSLAPYLTSPTRTPDSIFSDAIFTICYRKPVYQKAPGWRPSGLRASSLG